MLNNIRAFDALTTSCTNIPETAMRRFQIIACLFLLSCFCLSVFPVQADALPPDGDGPSKGLILSEQDVCAQDAVLSSLEGELLT